MNIRRIFSSLFVSALMLFSSVPAKAGIPVIDGANLAQAIQEILAWGQQAQQMVDQLQQLQQQYQQLQTMTTKLEGIRNLGTILNDPSIRASLPPEMRDATQLLMNPSALATSQANLNQILTSFGIDKSRNPTAGQAAADSLGRTQQILASSEARTAQLAQLAARVDTTVDAKDSLDMMNRNVLETANINNQMMQTMAALEAARQAAELKRLAENQKYFANLNSGAKQPLKTYSY